MVDRAPDVIEHGALCGPLTRAGVGTPVGRGAAGGRGKHAAAVLFLRAAALVIRLRGGGVFDFVVVGVAGGGHFRFSPPPAAQVAAGSAARRRLLGGAGDCSRGNRCSRSALTLTLGRNDHTLRRVIFAAAGVIGHGAAGGREAQELSEEPLQHGLRESVRPAHAVAGVGLDAFLAAVLGTDVVIAPVQDADGVTARPFFCVRAAL